MHDLTTADYKWASDVVRWRCLKNGVQFDGDVQSEMGLVLTKALRRYDPSRGASFRTFVFRRLASTVFDVLRARNGRKGHVIPRPTTTSLEETVPVGRYVALDVTVVNGCEAYRLGDLLPSGADHVRDLETRDLVDSIGALIRDEKVGRVLSLLARGESRRDAGAEAGVTESRVCQIVSETRERLALTRVGERHGC